MVKIFIDPGHGGSDPGAVGQELQEKEITLAIALKVKEILENDYSGLVIKLSRTTDQTLSLTARTNMANQWQADYLLSIHVNAGGGSGFESFTYQGNYVNKQQTNQLRTSIHQKIVNQTGWIDRGRKQANFHMLRVSLMPAMLTENGFIDHKQDARKLADNNFLTTIAQGHVDGLVHAFLLQKKHSSLAKVHTIKSGDTLWSLAIKYGTTVDKLQAINPGIVPKYLQIGQKISVK